MSKTDVAIIANYVLYFSWHQENFTPKIPYRSHSFCDQPPTAPQSSFIITFTSTARRWSKREGEPMWTNILSSWKH